MIHQEKKGDVPLYTRSVPVRCGGRSIFKLMVSTIQKKKKVGVFLYARILLSCPSCFAVVGARGGGE
jgi:hypothetical protein